MLDLDALSLTEIIRLQNQLSQALSRRFERHQALAFSDIVGSTPYFQRFGDQAGRKLQQRHTDILQAVLPKHGGRVVDTAGDGAFTCFATIDGATAALTEVFMKAAAENLNLPPEHHLVLRIGAHWGSVLTDGQLVTGDAVNLCSRVASSCAPGELRLTREAFQEIIDTPTRLRCSALPPTTLKGIERRVDLMRLEWRSEDEFPTHVQVEETGEIFALPDKPTISFGRLPTKDGVQANDIVLALPDEEQLKQISRWHFELRRGADGFVLRQLTPQTTEVDGQLVNKGECLPIKKGSLVQVARVMTLRFYTPQKESSESTLYEMTILPR